MRSRIILAIVIIAMVASAAIVTAQGTRGQRMRAGQHAGMAGACPMGMDMLGKLGRELNLTQAQITKLKAIRSDFVTSTQSARADIKAKIKQMIGLLTADNPDAAAIKDLARQIDETKAQIRDAGIDAAVKAMAVLTPDQRTKLRTMIKNRPAFGRMFGWHMGGACDCGMCMGAGMGAGAKGMGAGMK